MTHTMVDPRRGRQPGAPRQAAIDRGDWERVVPHLCHLVALVRTGKVQSVVERAVALALVIDDVTPLTTVDQVVDVLRTVLGLHLAAPEAATAIEQLVDNGRLLRHPSSGRLVLSATERADIQGRIDAAAELQRRIKASWLEQVAAQGGPLTSIDHDLLWVCLTDFLARMFRQHGVNAIAFLTGTDSPEDQGFGMHIDAAITQAGLHADRADVRTGIRLFLEHIDADRARYLAELLDGTFSFFALSVDDLAATYLGGTLPKLDLFLDTNVIFGMFGLHDNPLTEASLELLRIIHDNQLPFTLYYHVRTLDEIRTTLNSAAAELRSRHWSRELSRAIVATRARSGIVLRFHELNSQQTVDPAIFMSRWEHIDVLLEEKGVRIYRPSHDRHSDEDRWKLVADYKAFAEQRRRGQPERPYQALDHDMSVWLSIQKRRGRSRSPLGSGALLLSNDYLLQRFDWRHLRGPGSATVVLPTQLLQILRNYVPTSDDVDARFAAAFAAPELCSLDNNFAETQKQVVSYLATLRDVPERAAVRILENEIALAQLRGLEATSAEFEEAIDSLVLKDNARLLSEAEAARRLAQRDAEDAVAARDELAKVTAQVNELLSRFEERERRTAEERKAQEASEAGAQERIRRLEADVERSTDALAHAEERQARQRARIGYGVGYGLAVLLAVLTLLVPTRVGWGWLASHPHRTAIYLIALVIDALVGAAVAHPKHRVSIIVGGIVLSVVSLALVL